MMRSAIVKKVTASHDIVRGSSSAEIDVRSNMIRTTIVKKVTTSHDIVHGSSSA